MSLLTLFQTNLSSGGTALSATPSPLRILTISESGSTGANYRGQPSGIPVILHSPVATLDYTLDWGTSWLAAGEAITGTPIVTVPAGITNPQTALVAPGSLATQVQIWIAGGTIGTSYTVTCQIATTYGRIDERSFTLNCLLR